MVSRVKLWTMKQPADMGIRQYAASLRGQAAICKFQVHCTGCDIDISFSDEMIRDQVCRGVADPEIQRQLLGEKGYVTG